jgi:hypothetical protein
VDDRPFRLRPIPFKIIAVWTRAKRRVTSEPLTAWLGVVFTLVLAAFTGALVNVASRQTKILKHTDTALNSAATAQIQSAQTAEKFRRFTEVTERPWVSVDSVYISSALFFATNGDINLSVKFGLINSGRTPAVYTVTDVIAILIDPKNWSLDASLRKARKYCEARRVVGETGILVPPGRGVPYPYHNAVTINSEDIRVSKILTNGREAIVPYIFGCISYQFTFGERGGIRPDLCTN